jgi:hypothetical protein
VSLSTSIWVFLAILLMGAAGCAGAKPERLPEGYGLAARYPGDKGLASDPAVLLAEGFEEKAIADLGARWSDVSNKDGAVLSFDREVPAGSRGKHSLLMTADLRKNSGGHLYTTFRGVDRAFLRYYTKFAPDHGYEHHFVELGGYQPATPWPNPRAGSRPEGDDRVMVFTDVVGSYGKYPPPGIWSLYTYWPEMKISADQKYWGNCLSPATPQLVRRGEWVCVELMVKMNSAPEKADGELALWLGGKLVEHVVKGVPCSPWSGMGFDLLKQGGEPFEGLRLRTGDTLQINHVWIEHYNDEATQRTNKVEHPQPIHRVWFDDIVVSTQYIGPIR